LFVALPMAREIATEPSGEATPKEAGPGFPREAPSTLRTRRFPAAALGVT
jgi:hypothetical protein